MPAHNAAVKAVFRANIYTLTAITNNDTMGSFSDERQLPTGAKIKLTRTANGGMCSTIGAARTAHQCIPIRCICLGTMRRLKPCLKWPPLPITLSATVNNTLMGTVFPTSGNYASGQRSHFPGRRMEGICSTIGRRGQRSMHSDTLYMPGHNAAVIGVFKANTYSLQKRSQRCDGFGVR